MDNGPFNRLYYLEAYVIENVYHVGRLHDKIHENWLNHLKGFHFISRLQDIRMSRILLRGSQHFNPSLNEFFKICPRVQIQ